MADNAPEPDEFGWLRVKDEDTGHRSSIRPSQLPHGKYTVLKQPASNPLTGDPLPPEYAGSNSGPAAATTTKES